MNKLTRSMKLRSMKLVTVNKIQKRIYKKKMEIKIAVHGFLELIHPVSKQK